MKKINHLFYLEVYPFHVMFSCGETDEQLAKNLSLKMAIGQRDINRTKWKDPSHAGRFVQFSGKDCLIRIRNKPETALDYNFLQHEILHCTIAILVTVHLYLTDRSEEAYCYLNGYITQKIYEKLL
jgi:hypothetical protein